VCVCVCVCACVHIASYYVGCILAFSLLLLLFVCWSGFLDVFWVILGQIHIMYGFLVFLAPKQHGVIDTHRLSLAPLSLSLSLSLSPLHSLSVSLSLPSISKMMIMTLTRMTTVVATVIRMIMTLIS